MKKFSLVLGVILTQLLAPHSQATNASVPTALNPIDWEEDYLDLQTRAYLELMDVKFVPEDKVTGVPSFETDEETLGSCSAHAVADRTDQNERRYYNKAPGIVISCLLLEAGGWYIPYARMEVFPPPAQAQSSESINLSCSAHAVAECVTQSALPMTPTAQSYPIYDEIQQDLHPVARRALGHALFDANPEEAMRMCITHSVGERHRESAEHHVRLLGRQTLVDILNMMCLVARNRDAVVGRTSKYGTLKKPLLDWQDPFVEGSIFVSRAPMKSIAMKKPHDEDAQ